MAHVRRKFVDLYKSQSGPIAKEAIERTAALHAVEKKARGLPARERAALRDAEARDKLREFEAWLARQLTKVSVKTPLGEAIGYAIKRLPKLRCYLDDGRLELDNNAAERAMRPVTLGRKNWLFTGSNGGGRVLAIAFTVIETAKMNDVDPEAWLTWVLGRLGDHRNS